MITAQMATRVCFPDRVDPDLFGWAIQYRRIRIHKRLSRRWALLELIATHAEGGRIVVEQHGIDCDCNKYSGWLHEIPATLADFNELHESISEGVDGTYGLTVLSPSEARRITPESRDLIAEAHEDGHPWYVYA